MAEKKSTKRDMSLAAIAERAERKRGGTHLWFEAVRALEKEDPKLAHEHGMRLVERARLDVRRKPTEERFDMYYRTLLFMAPYNFDCYCQYIEKNRDGTKRFYLPRRKAIRPMVNALQRLADDEIDLLAISCPPGSGKTTLAIFFMTWLAGRDPDKPILGMSHSNAFLGGVYDECLQIMDPKGDYCWHDVFPESAVTKTNAKDMMINLDAPKRFTTLEFSSIGSGNAGKVRAENLLYCDDLCEGIEQAMSRERLDTLWQKYTDDARQRKIRDCKELHIATRWSVHDVIGRLERAYEGNPRAEFIALPATDEEGHSNFVACGFSDEFYAEQKSMMDDASWRALYMNQPIEREGQLYIDDELRRYFELPDGEPDAIIAVCDTKDRGNDYCVMPIAYQWGNDFYIEKIICDNGDPGSIEARLVAELVNRKVHLARFESNAAGGKIAEKVQSGVKERNGRCKITTKFTSANKETKIMVNAPWVKEHCLFREGKNIDSEYRSAMRMLCGYTLAGKNKHDDVPDAFAMLAEFSESLAGNKVQFFRRPW